MQEAQPASKTNQREDSSKSTSSVYRSMPQSLEAEKGVLCSALLSPKDVLSECIEKVSVQYFYDPIHQTIYELLIELWKNSKPIDFITIVESLKSHSLLDKVGGVATISELFTFLSTASNAEYYIEIVREKFLLRQLIQTCTNIASRAYEEQHNIKNLIDEAETSILAVGEERHKKQSPELKEQIMRAITEIENLYQRHGGITGLSTGFKKVDQMLGGLQGGELFVIAARPSMGKTAFAMNIAEHVAVELQKPVGIFSLEMSSQQLVYRMLCSRSKVNLQQIRDGFLSQHGLTKIVQAASDLSNSKIYIDDTSSLGILELRAKARRMKNQSQVELIVIDYLQLMRSHSKRAQENRQIEIAEISSGLKALAKELDIPVLVLAQLNRKPEERGGLPRLSDLRESGTIEQDADCVGLLVRSEYYEATEEGKQEKSGEAELIIAKQRNGPVGHIPLTFLKECTCFTDRATDEVVENVPVSSSFEQMPTPTLNASPSLNKPLTLSTQEDAQPF